MPTADFKDNITEEIFEVFFKSGPIPNDTVNPNTGNKSDRIFSGNVGFSFIGSGFYENDYKNKK